MEVEISNLGSKPLTGNIQAFLIEPLSEDPEKRGGFLSGNFSFVGTATYVDGDLKTDSVEDLDEAAVTYSGDIQWTSYEDKYFIKALVPAVDSGEKTVFLERGDEFVQNRIELSNQQVGPGKRLRLRFVSFFGPRDTDLLKEVGFNLEKAVNFGFFHIIAKPLLDVLKFFNSYVGNYGVSIIILTLLIKLLFWPLTQKSYTSMKAMQKIQPEMAKIRVKYKNDKARLNKEVMDLYRKHKVNPLGGCLPMLIQIPVFFALYKVLLGDIALRHAPFVFWIQDLSAKDPYYITPVIMGLTMFVQQKLTPTTMDSAQAKMLQYMPLIFTFMFLNFPSGLVIYWLVNNLLTILQQYLINRKPSEVEA
jgi:YidC/Oxa1 family membrane protein insertase